jgi:Sec-independent protein translocase protein TatA
MPQYRGTPGPKKWEWLSRGVGGGVGGFWDSIGNVIEENTQLKKNKRKKNLSKKKRNPRQEI